jgi:hypothetical protein
MEAIMSEGVPFNDVVCITETDLAILCEIEGGEFWIPVSQIDDESEVWKKGDTGQLVVSEWFATEKGLI